MRLVPPPATLLLLILSSGAMGLRHSKTFHESGALKSYKGVEYDTDGVSVTNSLFEQIADGTVLPGADGSPAKERRLLFQDERVACFVPLNAGSDEHVLVVPRQPAGSGRFIKTVDDLELSASSSSSAAAAASSDDMDLLTHMVDVGATVLQAMRDGQGDEEEGGRGAAPPCTITATTMTNSGASAGRLPSLPYHGLFHRPPFNSIDHLHLHVFGSSRRGRLVDYLKYPEFDTPWCMTLRTLLARHDDATSNNSRREAGKER